ncbi:MAG: GGDEF domain-containing protein, partial [Bdellovibrionia bacterium]
MNQEHLEESLREIRQVLSLLHGEITVLEDHYSRVLLVLERFEGAADIDDLTGLLRRRAFFRKWQALLDACEKLQKNCGVLMIDIDHFKKVNDTHGHPTGDEVIKRVASLLKQYESPRCLVSRLGGEEFAVAIQGT